MLGKGCNLQAINKIIRNSINQRILPIDQPRSPITLPWNVNNFTNTDENPNQP